MEFWFPLSPVLYCPHTSSDLWTRGTAAACMTLLITLRDEGSCQRNITISATKTVSVLLTLGLGTHWIQMRYTRDVIPPLHSFAQPFVYMKWKGLCKFKSCQTLNSNKVIICFDHNMADVNIAHVNTGGFNNRPSLKSYIFLFFVINNFLFFFSHTTQHISKINQTKQQTHTQHLKVNQKGGGEGRTTRTQKLLLYIITYYSTKNTASINGRRPGPTDLAPLYIHMRQLQEATGPICFLHMCGVNQFWIIVFFTAVKPANNILFALN